MPIINFHNEEIEERRIDIAMIIICAQIFGGVGGIVPYSYHNIQKYGFYFHHFYPNSGYCLGLSLLSSSFGDR
jgi:hypothetical protein